MARVTKGQEEVLIIADQEGETCARTQGAVRVLPAVLALTQLDADDILPRPQQARHIIPQFEEGKKKKKKESKTRVKGQLSLFSTLP
jgi:hypothetical protein